MGEDEGVVAGQGTNNMTSSIPLKLMIGARGARWNAESKGRGN